MNKSIMLVTVLLFLGSCASTRKYLPEADAVGSSPYGSYVKMETLNGKWIEGELVAFQNDTLIVGTKSIPSLKYIYKGEINSLYVQFCRTHSFALAPLFSLSHGLWLVFTFPVNLIVATAMTMNEKVESRYYNPQPEDLKMYARYPEGLPPGFSAPGYIAPFSK